MKRILALALTFATTLSGSSLFAATPRTQQNGSICGTATSQTGDVLPNNSVRVRDLSTGQVVGTQTTNDKGEYCMANLPPGNYAVEAVNASGAVIGTSASVSVAAGQVVTGVVLQTTATLAGAGAAAAGAAAGSSKGLSTAVMIAVAAGTAFIGSQTSSSSSASPSR